MKKDSMLRLFAYVGIFLFLSVNANAQLISWNASSLTGGSDGTTGNFGSNPWPTSTLNANLTLSTGFTRGSSIATSGTPASSCWGGSGGWSSSGGADNQAFYFVFTANSGYTVSLSSITGYTRKSNTGPTGCNIDYSINGGAYTTAGSWTTTATTGTTGTAGSTSLTGIGALQNVPAGTTIKIRIAPTGSTTGNWYLTNTSSVVINGTVTAASSDYYWNGGSNTTSPANGGTGTWTTANNWRSGSSTGPQATFGSGQANVGNVYFQGNAGIVTDNAAGTFTATGTSGFLFNTSGYTLATNSSSNTVLNGNIVLGNNVGLTLAPNLGSASGSGQININGNISGTGTATDTIPVVNSSNTRIDLLGATATVSVPTVISGGAAGTGWAGYVIDNSTGSTGTISGNIYIGGSGGGRLMLGATNGSSSQNVMNVTGTISGPNGVIICAGAANGGSGIVQLSAANNYSGNTEIAAGPSHSLLQNGIANALPTSGILTVTEGSYNMNGFNQTIRSLKDGASVSHDSVYNNSATATTLTLSQSTSGSTDYHTFSGVLGGNLALVLGSNSASTALTLSGANYYTGGTTVNDGTLNASSTSALGASANPLTVNNNNGHNSTVNINNSLTIGSLSGSGSGTVNVGPGVTFTDNQISNTSYSGDISGTGNFITKSGAGTLTINTASNSGANWSVTAGALIVNGLVASGPTWTISGSGLLGGTGTITRTVQVQSGAAITGGTAGATGLLHIANGSLSALDWGGGAKYQFDISNVSTMVAGTDYDQIAVAGQLNISASSGTPMTIAIAGNPTGWSATTAYTWTIATAGSLTGFSAGSFTLNTSLFTATTAGVFAISQSGNNLILTYTPYPTAYYWNGNGTSALNGTWNNANILWAANTGSPVLFAWPTTGANDTAYFTNTFGGTVTLPGTIAIAPSSTVISAPYTFTGTTAALAGSIALNATLNSAISASLAFSGAINGTGSLVQNGAGALVLSGNNSYTGGTTINAGSLNVTDGTNTGTGTISFSSASTAWNISGTAATFSNNIVLGNVSGNISIVTANNSSTVINGMVSGGGSSAVWYFQGGSSGSNTGALTLNGTNTLAGTINVQRGPLILGNAAGAGTTSILLNSNNPAAGALQLAGNFNISNGVQMYGSTQNIGVGSTYVAGIGGVISANSSYGFTKVGTGTLVLSGANTYTGAASVSAGALFINGSTSASSALSTSSGTVLGGNGTAAGTVSLSGTVSPGSAAATVGTFSTGAFTFNANSTYKFEVANANGTAGTDYDVLASSGTITCSASPVTIDITSLSGIINFVNTNTYTWTIATGSSISGFNPANFNLITTNFAPALGGGGFSIAQSGNSIVLIYLPANSNYYWNGNGASALNGTWSVSGTNLWAVSTTTAPVLAWPASGTPIANFLNTHNGTVTLPGTISVAPDQTIIGAGTAYVFTGSTASLTSPIALNSGLTLTPSANITLSGIITGTGALTNSGSGLLTLSGANTYTGGTTITSGTVQVQNATALGTGTCTFSGGTQAFGILSGGLATVANNFVLNTTGFTPFTVQGTGNVTTPANTAVQLNGIVSGGAAGQTFIFGESGTTSNHNNTLILNNGANSFLGTMEINRGVVSITSAGALGNAANGVYINDNNNNGGFRFDANISLASGHNFTLGQNENINTNGNYDTIAGTISGGTSLTKIGAGALNISAASALQYPGVTYLSAGTLQINSNTFTSAHYASLSASTVLESYGTLSAQANASATYGFITGGSSGILRFTSATNSAAVPDIYFNSNDADNAVTNYGTTINTTVDLGSLQRYVWGKTNHNSVATYGTGSDCVFLQPITGSGGLTFLAQDNYTNSNPIEVPFYLYAANTFTGPVVIQRGSVYLGNAASLAQANATNGYNALTFSPVGGNNARLYLYGNSASVSNLTSAGAGTSTIAASPGAATAAVTLTVNQTGNTVYGGTIVQTLSEYSGSGTVNPLSLTLNGSGSLTLSGTNSYTGTTTVNSGSLIFAPNTSETLSGAVELNGGTLGTTGIAASSVLTFGTLNVASGSSTIALGGSTHSVKFSGPSSGTWSGTSLTVGGWTGSPGVSGTTGKIFVGTTATLSAAQLAKISFTGFSGTAYQLSTGEIVPSCVTPDAIIFGTQPSNVVQDATMATVTVKAICSASGLTSSTYTGNITLSVSGGGCGYSSQTVAAVAGVATFSNIKFDRSVQTGITLTASASGFSNVLSNTFNVTAPAGTPTNTTIINENFDGSSPTWPYTVSTVSNTASSGTPVVGLKNYGGTYNNSLVKSHSTDLTSSGGESTSQILFNNVSGLGGYNSVKVSFLVGSLPAVGGGGSGAGVDNNENMVIETSLDGGSTWNTLLTYDGYSDYLFPLSGTSPVTLAYNANASYNSNHADTSTQSAFVINLPGGTTQFQMRITATDNRTEENWAIDNIQIIGTTTGTGVPKALPTASGINYSNCPNTATPIAVSLVNTQGTTTYSWSPAANINNTTVSGPTVNIPSTSTYTVTATDADGCTASASDIITITSPPGNVVLAGATLSANEPTCADASGWTYYTDPANANNWVFGIYKNGNTFNANVDLTVVGSANSVINNSYQKGLFTMGRFWNVTLATGSINGPANPVKVRFFYSPSDTAAMRTAAAAQAAAWGLAGTTVNGIEWFKTSGVAYNPVNNTYSDVPNKLLPSAFSVSSGVINGVSYIEYDGLQGFSGGTGAIRVSPGGYSLPVSLVNFNAEPVNDLYIRLLWETASETGNSGFEVQRSTDGTSFEKIAWVNGNGTKASASTYELNDVAVQPNVIYYYRLKQLDYDGHFEYSDILSATIIGEKAFVMEDLRPNPAAGSVYLNVVTKEVQDAQVHLTDMLGREILSRTWSLSEGLNGFTLDISSIPTGTYTVNIKTAAYNASRKLVVTR